MSDAEAVQEVVIVRRARNDDDDGHHGGVWKIAFADFMTAMMAFFLVMWLINAANEETKKSVASYFNPVKLTDTTSNPKGVQDPIYGASRKDKPVTKDESERFNDQITNAPGDTEKVDEPENRKIDEQSLFKDPYAVLAEIMKSADHEIPSSSKVAEQSGNNVTASGLNGGEAFRDPFDPASWRDEPSPPAVQSATAMPRPTTEVGPSENVEQTALPPLPAEVTPTETAAESQSVPSESASEQKLPDEGELAKEVGAALAAAAKAEAEKKAKEMAEDAARVAEAIREEAGELATGPSPAIEVAGGSDGVTISLTDSFDFEMFSIGSARPRAELIRVMEAIAHVLGTEQGTIAISGHTDARPFRSENYDNWRLSTARAHMAYYMLVRGGLEARRIERIEGHADRRLKNMSDPEAAANRRIEIVLNQQGTSNAGG